jgi:ankyrin repeat protein
LLAAGANVHELALDLACEGHGMADMVKMLLANGASPHANEGSAFRQACAFSNVDIAEVLCEHGNMAPYCSSFLNELVSAKVRL